ncbi:MvdC/MvdD family ATP grasp protein [Yinghuangia sp. YIM S10712]|uniref:MvdC/MvdD family ATP grasp protein n=1 Tax=Yinghuangia sp. YIM S10712 TaxID=3436930 RepID=UPI003F538C39
MATKPKGTSTRGEEPRVLVVTHDLDPTADFVLRELSRREVPFWRTDLAHFPLSTKLRSELRPDGSWVGDLRRDGRGVDWSELRAVWWRKPTPFAFADSMSTPEQAFAASQAKRAFAGIFASLPDVLWVNQPERIADCTKPRQLSAATIAGLKVPATLITNDPSAVTPFAMRHGRRIITKALGGIVHTEDGKRGQLYTSRVPPQDWPNLRIGLTTHLFQQEIVDKAYEVRVTIVGNRMFPVRIHAPEGPGRLDWRRDSGNLRYEADELPASIERGLNDMMRSLGLVFAGIDLIVDSTGTHWLIDVNTGGQWAWIDLVRDDITAAIADLLEKGNV